MNVALIDLPFTHLDCPSSGLTTLKSVLGQHDIQCKCFPLGLEFALIVGIDRYEDIVHLEDSYICNWLFARIAFPNSDINSHEKYMLQHIGRYELGILELMNMRSKCEEFVVNQDKGQWDNFDVIGLTTGGCLHSALALGRLIKERDPNKIIVYGGWEVHEEAAIEFVKELEWIDYIVVGEAENSFPQLLKMIESRDQIDLEGVAYKDNGSVKYNPSQTQVNVNINPVPDMSDYIDRIESVEDEKDRHKLMSQLCVPLELSRGCVYGTKMCCTFCADVEIQNYNYRMKTNENALAYIIEAHEKYPSLRKFDIWDSMVTVNYINKVFKKWIETRKYKTSFFLQTKPTIKRQHVKILADFGVTEMQLGIESLATEMLKLLRKGQSTLQCISALKWSRTYGIKVLWMSLFRVPEEHSSYYYETANLCHMLHHLEPPRFSPVIITKKSPYWQEKSHFKFKNLRPCVLYKSIYPSCLDLNAIAWNFEYDDENYNGDLEIYDYDLHSAKTHAVLREAVNMWEQNKTAQLYLDNNVIYDSRSEQIKQHEITSLERDLLIYCDAPQHINSIKSSFGDINETLIKLIEKELILTIEDKYLTLVVLTDKQIGESDLQSAQVILPMRHNIMQHAT